MGLIVSLVKKKFGEVEGRVLCLGLDNAGKSTVLYRLQMGDVVCTLPTVGFNVENIKYKNVDLTVWDIGGQAKIRRLWRYYYENTEALIFVVDSNDADRLEEAKTELWKLLGDLKEVPLLVFANKMDLPNAQKDLASVLGLQRLKQREWHVQPSNAVHGHGLETGLDWLCDRLIAAKRQRNNPFFFHFFS